MTEDMRVSEGELVRRLTNLSEHVVFPPTPDIAGAVSTQLLQRVPGRPAVKAPLRRLLLLFPVLAALAILGLVLTFSPGTRSAAASWLRLPGFQILPSGPISAGRGHGLHLGARVSLPEAQRRVRFKILVPAVSDLRRPDEVFAGTPPLSADSVSLLYRSRPGLPRATTTGAGLLITKFQRHLFDLKRLPLGHGPQIVWLSGQPGFWLAGAPHLLYFVDPEGRALKDTRRLAGNVLVWRQGSVVLRLEGRISLQHALAIARSTR